jgi:hypothetical protein
MPSEGASSNRLIVPTSASPTEHVHATVQSIDLLNNRSSGHWGSSSATGSSDRSSSGEGPWVGEEVFEGLGLGKGEVVEPDGDSDTRLEGASDGVRNRGLGGVSDSQADGSQAVEGVGELADDDSGGDVENIEREDASVLVDALDAQTIGEGLDVQLGQESSLGVADLVTDLDELDRVGDLDLTLLDLGGDLEHLEKVGLSRITTGGAGRDGDTNWSNSTDSGRGGDLVGEDDVSDVAEVAIGEDKADVALDLLKESLAGVVGVLLEEIVDDAADQSVLSHQNLSSAAESDTGLVELLRADIIDLDRVSGEEEGRGGAGLTSTTKHLVYFSKSTWRRV